MNITDIVGFFQVVVPYLEVIIVLVVAFFVISFDVTLRKTRLKTCDGTIVVLPNGKIDSSGWVLHKKKTEDVGASSQKST